MKRFRDESGKLTMSIDAVAAATMEESHKYYIDGGLYMVEGRYAIYNADVGGLGLFESSDGHKLFVDPDRLGTFLPDVADDDLAIVRA